MDTDFGPDCIIFNNSCTDCHDLKIIRTVEIPQVIALCVMSAPGWQG